MYQMDNLSISTLRSNKCKFTTMALAAMELAAFSIISTSPKFNSYKKPFSFSSLKLPLINSNQLSTQHPLKKSNLFHLQAAVEQAVVSEEKVDESQRIEIKRKLYVYNLPWTLSVVDIKSLFGECGTVVDVEIIKQKNGKSRGFAFVTMESGEEAQAVIEKFNSYEVDGRIITVQFAKRFRKPPPVVHSRPSEGDARLYVSNLAWKVRSNNLRELFSSESNPISARVIFDSPSGKSAGYGFVSFATKEEAELAISTFEGKELLGRPIRLKFSEKKGDASETTEELGEQQPEES